LLERLRGQPVADPRLRMLWALGASAMLRDVADREAERAGTVGIPQQRIF
jgi:hypothetical protein